MLCKWEGAVINGKTGKSIEYRHLKKNLKY